MTESSGHFCIILFVMNTVSDNQKNTVFKIQCDINRVMNLINLNYWYAFKDKDFENPYCRWMEILRKMYFKNSIDGIRNIAVNEYNNNKMKKSDRIPEGIDKFHWENIVKLFTEIKKLRV